MGNWKSKRLVGLALAGCSLAAYLPTTAFAAEVEPQREYNIPAQDLASALEEFGRQSGTAAIFDHDALAGKHSSAVAGRLNAATALRSLLAGTGLGARNANGNTFVVGISSGEVLAGSAAASDESAEVIVTGSRIRGGKSASPVITLTQSAIANSGINSVADAVRAIPQNYSGGQNPGVTVGAGGSPDNENVGAGSTFNLRGLGQSATLTLLNGHRLAYDINAQGVDVSTIPLDALDRIEVVADGASALYGSDAVAGVANVILKPDYDGLSTTARLGAATDGGDFQQQYDLVTGRRWKTGGFILAYDFERDTAINAGSRSYTSEINPNETLVPYQRHHSVIASAHQDLASNLTFSLEGLFNRRWSSVNFEVAPTGTYRDLGILSLSKSTAFSVTPSLKWRLGGDWEVTTTGVYAEDHGHYTADLYVGGALVAPTAGCYCNSFKSAEISAEGPIFHLPAGDVRAALGGGYRTNTLHAFRTAGEPQDIDASQSTYYAFGEIAVPLIDPSQGIAGMYRLSANGALRYERYPGVGAVTTPKLGLIYSPMSWLDLKGSWGRSFKAPTLYQEYSGQASDVEPVTAAGGSGYPANATVAVLSGSNPALKPERAVTWSGTFAVRPAHGLELQISYFNINYRDRVVPPIPIIAGALSNPNFGSLIELQPSAADQLASIDESNFGVNNLTDGTIDPSDIVAIIDNRYRNIARQKIDGLDVAISYSRATAAYGTFALQADGTYLHSTQILGPGQSSFPLAGTIFNPPHLRGRGGLTWSKGEFGVSSYANYTGHLIDNRYSPSPIVKANTTVDLALHYDMDRSSGPLAGVGIIASVLNVFNQKPDIIRTDTAYFPPYDSTNYSAVGRFVSLAIRKRW